MPSIDAHDLIVFVEILVGAILGGGGVIAFFKLRPENRRTDAETTRVITEMWETLYKQLERRVTELEGQHDADQTRIGELEAEVDDLRAWIEQQGLTPPPRKRSRGS